jgi:hypothetical protein
MGGVLSFMSGVGYIVDVDLVSANSDQHLCEEFWCGGVSDAGEVCLPGDGYGMGD